MTLLKEACSHRRPSCLHLDAGQGTGCGKILVISGESFISATTLLGRTFEATGGRLLAIPGADVCVELAYDSWMSQRRSSSWKR